MQNKDVVRRAYELFNAGKVAEAGDLFAADAVWSFPGRNALTGEYKGRDAIIKDLLPKFAALTNASYRATLTDLADGGEHTFALHHSQAERDGQPYDYDACNIFTVKDSLIREVRSFPWDAHAQDAFWH